MEGCSVGLHIPEKGWRYTVHYFGLLLANTVSGGTLRAKQFNIAQYPDLGNYVGATVTINLGDAEENKDRTLYGRGYVIVKMKDNTYAIRFADDVVSGTFNSISSGN